VALAAAAAAVPLERVHNYDSNDDDDGSAAQLQRPSRVPVRETGNTVAAKHDDRMVQLPQGAFDSVALLRDRSRWMNYNNYYCNCSDEGKVRKASKKSFHILGVMGRNPTAKSIDNADAEPHLNIHTGSAADVHQTVCQYCYPVRHGDTALAHWQLLLAVRQPNRMGAL